MSRRAIVLPLALTIVITAVVVIAVYWREAARIQSAIRDAAIERARVVDYVVQSKLSDAATILLTIARSEAMERYASGVGDEAARDWLGREFEAVVEVSPNVEDLRLFAADGRELMRLRQAGEPGPTGALPDEGDRIDLSAVRGLAVGEVLVSDFRLAVEGGQIEVPWKPVVRMATLIDEPNGFRGVLVMNQPVGKLLDPLTEAFASEGIELEVLDSEGFRMRSSDSAQEWGSQVPDRADETMANRNPALWEAILSAEEGSLTVGGITYVWRRLRFEESAGGSGLELSLVSDGESQVILGRIDPAFAEERLVPWRLMCLGLFLVSGVASCWIVLLRVTRRADRRRAGEAIRASEIRLNEIFESVPVSLWDEDWTEVIAEVRLLRAGGVVDFSAYCAENPEFVNGALQKVRTFDVNGETVRMLEAASKDGILSSPETRECFAAELLALAEGAEFFMTETSLLTRKGNLIEVDLRMSFPPVGSESGRVVVGLIDVTARNRVRLERDRAVARNTAIVNAVGNAVCVIDPETMRFLDANPAACMSLGIPRDDLLRLGPFDIKPKRSHEAMRDAITRSLADSRSEKVRLEHLRSDGSTFPVEVVLQSYAEGERRLIVVSARDLSEQMDHQTELETINAQLRRSNEELEQFAYVASHDLQEPLRMVASFSQLISKKYADLLDEQGQRWIGFAVDGASRMQTLINDLLDFSRLSTRGQERRPVDSKSVVDAALKNLGQAIQESGAIIECGPLPMIEGDPGQLALLFQNLISNAIKYRGEAQPIIKIAAIPLSDDQVGEAPRWEFAVGDNGIGIDAAYHAKIFVIFQRLHTREQYAGTGIGLAMCRKIVETHGGAIRVESSRENGSTFRFSLPGEKTPPEL